MVSSWFKVLNLTQRNIQTKNGKTKTTTNTAIEKTEEILSLEVFHNNYKFVIWNLFYILDV